MIETRTIEEVTEALIDYRGKTPEKTKSGVVLITAKVIKDGRILDENHEYISEAHYNAWMRRGLPKLKDILITTEAPLGEVAQLKKTEKVALAQRVILLRGNPQIISQDFYFHALRSPFVKGELSKRATGTTVLGIKQSELRKVKIPYFPLPIQSRIATILSAYDDLIENNTRRIQILEEMARRIYEEWFVRFRFPGHENVRMVESELGWIPDGWETRSVTQMIEFDPRTTVPREGMKPFVPMSSLAENSMLITNIESRAGNSGSKFRNGDTLFARITPCLENGKTGFVDFLPDDNAVAVGSTEYIVLRSKTVTPEFVYLTARSNRFRENAIKSMSGATGRQRVRVDSFIEFQLAQPDKVTLDKFSEVISPTFKAISCLSKKKANLRETRDLLLPKLISGEIDVSNFPESVSH